LRDKRLLGYAIISLVFCLTISQVVALISPPTSIWSHGTIEQNIFVVALDGSGDFRDIQRAIDAVPDGEYWNILVKQGIYVLNPVQRWPSNQIVVKPRITLRGEGIDKTIIRFAPTPEIAVGCRQDVITSTADVFDFVLKDLTVDQNAPAPDNAGSSAIYFRTGNHRNLVIQRVKVTNAFGAGISVPRFNGVTVEECQIYNVWTGINIFGGTNFLVKGNRVVNITGNGIFPQAAGDMIVTNVVIEDNYLENVGDTGIGICAAGAGAPHQNITIRRNTMKTCGVGISGGKDIYVIGNTIETTRDLPIYADVAGGLSSNIVVDGNKIITSSKNGIGFYTSQDCRATNNEITMLPPSPGETQIGILAVIRGTGLIENNTIINPANYGIDFAGWSVSSSSITIRGNTLLDFGDIGIYDSALNQGPILIENNTIWDRRTPFVSRYGIRTDAANKWTIRYNYVYAGTIAYISAPSSNVYDNIYEPPK